MFYIIIALIMLNINNFSFQQSNCFIEDKSDIVLESISKMSENEEIVENYDTEIKLSETDEEIVNVNLEKSEVEEEYTELNAEENNVEDVNIQINNFVPVNEISVQVEQVEEEKIEIQPNDEIIEYVEETPQEIINEVIEQKEETKDIPVQEEIQEHQVIVEQNNPLSDCEIGNHYAEVGNSGKWFNSKEEAISEYTELQKSYGDKLRNKEITKDEYYIKCPYGYEIWSCMFCNKWTINYYYH